MMMLLTIHLTILIMITNGTEEWGGWNDPADDNSSGSFDYSYPHVCKEWCAWDGRRNDGLCCDPYRSDVADGEPAISWKPD